MQPTEGYAHVAQHHLIPVVTAEFVPLSANAPIIFVKDGATGQFKAAALMGIEPGKNLILGVDYANTNYIPINVRRYPYCMVADDANDEQFAIGIETQCPWLNQEGKGYSLFTDEGKPSEELNQVANFLIEASKQESLTAEFINFLVNHQLLEEAELTLNLGESGSKKLTGVYQVATKQLEGLSDEAVISAHRNNYNSAIYAHLASLGQLQKLVNLTSRL